MTQLLLPGKCYMLRNDGKLFENTYRHPYVIDYIIAGFDKSIRNVIRYRSYLLWFYKNTKQQEVKDIIDSIDASIKSRKYKVDEIVEKVKYLDDLVNGEFLRLRMSDMYYKGTSKSLFIRVSQVPHNNWFDLIWKIVYENDVSDVTITKDLPDLSDIPYVIHGVEISHMPKDEFITLPGNIEI